MNKCQKTKVRGCFNKQETTQLWFQPSSYAKYNKQPIM